MARGGSRGRRTNYVRDNSGRFASTPGGGPPKRSTPASRRAARATVTGGTLGARGSLRRSRAKLAAKNPADRSLRGSLSLRAQKGAVTRGVNRLGKVRASSTVQMTGKGPAGVIRGGRKAAAGPVALVAPKDYKRGRSAAAGYKPKTDRTLASSQVGTRAKLSEFQRAEAQTAKRRFGVRSTAQSARIRAGSYDPAKRGSGRVTFRTKAEARKAYLKRAAATKSTASKSYNDGRYAGDGVKTGTKGSARIRTAAVAQGNLLSGKADNVKARKVRSFSGRSALGGAMRKAAAKSAKPVAAQPKPSTPARKPATLKWEKPAGSVGRQTASLPGGRRVNVYLDGKGATASIFNERDRSPVMNRKDFRNVTEAKKWAASPSARGPRILGRYQPSGKRRKAWEMPTDASPSLANIQGKKARPSGTIAKPRDLKPGAIAARTAKAAKPAAPQGPKLLLPAKGRDRQGQRQRAEARAIANYNRSIKAQPETKKQAGRAAIGQVTATRAVEFLRGVKRIGPQRGMTSRVLPKGFVPQSRPGIPAPTAQPRPDRKPSGENQKPKRKTAAQKPTRSPSRLPQETRSALRDIAGRRVQAEQALTGQIQKLGGITKQQAQAVFSYYSKRKFIKYQGIDGVGVKSGNLLDKDTIRQALQLAQEPAQPRKPRRR